MTAGTAGRALLTRLPCCVGGPGQSDIGVALGFQQIDLSPPPHLRYIQEAILYGAALRTVDCHDIHGLNNHERSGLREGITRQLVLHLKAGYFGTDKDMKDCAKLKDVQAKIDKEKIFYFTSELHKTYNETVEELAAKPSSGGQET